MSGAGFSPVTQVEDLASIPSVPEEKISEEEFNRMLLTDTTYRDLVFFEERLRLNLHRLRKRQVKYEAFLGCLIVVIAYCAFATFYHPSPTYYIHSLHKFFLLLSATTLFLFFATGMYSEKLGYPSKFVPQCNRVLRTYNMYFNRDNRPELSFFRRVPKLFQEQFNAYKVDFLRRRMERRAAGLSGLGSKGVAGGEGMRRTASGQGRRLQPSSRGRRRGGGGGSASGSDSGALSSSTGVSSLTRSENLRPRNITRAGPESLSSGSSTGAARPSSMSTSGR